MNIYIRELRAHRKSLVIWSLGILFLIYAGMGKYSAGAKAGAAGFDELMKQFPKSLQNMFGVGVFDLSKALDYYGVLFIYIALMVTIQAAMLGAGIISKEERDKTVEFLMVKPVSRQRIITAKLLAAGTMVLILNLVTSVSSIYVLSIYSKGEPYRTKLMLLMLALFMLQLLFAALGACCSAFTSRGKLSSSMVTGILMLMFMLAVIVDIAGNLNFLRYATFFKYFDAKDILKGGYNLAYSIISIVLLATFVYGTYFFYVKRDLKV